MSKQRGGCVGGCLTFLAGLPVGAILAFVLTVGWQLTRPVDLTPLTNQLGTSGSDLEITLSEAYLNQAVAEELAKRDLEQVARIVVDAQPGAVLKATLEGRIDLGGLTPPAPKVETLMRLGVEEGQLMVRLEEATVGPLRLVRDDLSELVLPLFESVETTLQVAMNKPVVAQGFAVREVRSDDKSLTIGLEAR